MRCAETPHAVETLFSSLLAAIERWNPLTSSGARAFALKPECWGQRQARNFTGNPDLWMESPPGVREGEQPAVRSMQEYGANWVFGVAGRF
jgi:hypothetical protein